VRARLVMAAEAWTWSSAAAHCGTAEAGWLAMEAWNERWDVARWREYLQTEESASELRAMRQSTHTGRPLGSEEFVRALEERTERTLAPRRGGRPAKFVEDARQEEFVF
jgi:putative transposase